MLGVGSNFGELLPSLSGAPDTPVPSCSHNQHQSHPHWKGAMLAPKSTPPAPQPLALPRFGQEPLAPTGPLSPGCWRPARPWPPCCPPAPAAPALRPAPCRPRCGVSRAPPLPRRAPPAARPAPPPKGAHDASVPTRGEDFGAGDPIAPGGGHGHPCALGRVASNRLPQISLLFYREESKMQINN